MLHTHNRACCVCLMIALAATACDAERVVPMNERTYGQKYRYVLKHRFRKIKPGDDMRFVYLPIPVSSDYQEISNVDPHAGEVLLDPVTQQRYVRYANPIPPGSEEWGEVVLEFDYVPKGTEFQQAVIEDVYPYDTTTDLYKKYTSGDDSYIDTSNPVMQQASDTLWDASSDAYDYARRCLAHVRTVFQFKNVGTGWYTTEDLIANNGGDCGNLSSLFITLLRCKGVPARHVIVPGHAWAEFYLEKHGWIPVDPTFGLFGRASSGYDQLVWAHYNVFHVKTDDNDAMRSLRVCQHHHIYPSHRPYECDIQEELKSIPEPSPLKPAEAPSKPR